MRRRSPGGRQSLLQTPRARMGRAQRVLIGLGLALVLTLFLCDDIPVAQPSREPENSPGGTRTKLNGQPHEVEVSDIFMASLKSQQSSDITGHLSKAALKYMFNSHGRQRRSSLYEKLIKAAFKRPNAANPLYATPPPEASSTTQSEPSRAPTTPAPTTTTLEPTVVTVFEVNVAGFGGRPTSEPKGGGGVFVSFGQPEREVSANTLQAPEASRASLAALNPMAAGLAVGLVRMVAG